MRSTLDRIRHALSFEIIALFLIAPLGALVFSTPLEHIGVIAIAGATIATLWNYLYNLGFDHALRRWAGTTEKTVPTRIAHALLFEAGLLAVLMPMIAVYLDIGLWQAFLMDASFALFYVVYAFVFNWSYDRVFPIPVAEEKPA